MFWKKPSILIIEDEPNNHPLFTDVFTAAGFEVTIRGDADGDLVDDVVAIAPDIISLDLMIGSTERIIERDGFTALELLKADERTASIPVIVLTNFFQTEKVWRAKELGAVDYILLQGQELPKIAAHYKEYLDSPRKFVPVHEVFRD